MGFEKNNILEFALFLSLQQTMVMIDVAQHTTMEKLQRNRVSYGYIFLHLHDQIFFTQLYYKCFYSIFTFTCM